MKLELTRGQEAEIDEEDYNLVSSISWFAAKEKDKDKYYAVGRLKGNRKLIKLHRYLLNVSDSTIIIDHIDGNSLNNKRSNLRVATTSQNAANRTKSKTKKYSSNYIGVSICIKDNGRYTYWRATCIKDGIRHAKIYKTELEAAEAYNIMAKELHGEFAAQNDIAKTILANL